MKSFRYLFRLFLDYVPLVWAVLLLALIVLGMGSCSGMRYVPVETTKTDSVFIVQYERDSIYTRDSIFVDRVADTVFVNRTQWMFRDRIVRDTVRVCRVDSVQTVVEVERELSRIEKLKMNVGMGVLWAVPIIIGLWVFLRFIRR